MIEKRYYKADPRIEGFATWEAVANTCVQSVYPRCSISKSENEAETLALISVVGVTPEFETLTANFGIEEITVDGVREIMKSAEWLT